MRNIISIRILFLIIVFSIFAVSSYTDGNTYAQNARTLQQELLLTSKDSLYPA